MFDTNLILKSNTDDQRTYHVSLWARVSMSRDWKKIELTTELAKIVGPGWIYGSKTHDIKPDL